LERESGEEIKSMIMIKSGDVRETSPHPGPLPLEREGGEAEVFKKEV
jgi:hypothetical protein